MKVIKANLSHLGAFKIYAARCFDDGLALYADAQGDADAYFKKRLSYAEGKELPDGWPPISMYFCIDSENILGAIRVRHGDNDYIKNVIGHIGYETLPEARGKGIASIMLNWVKLNVIDHSAILICNTDNVASKKVIEKCGGQYLNTFYCDEEAYHVVRYQLACR